MTDRAAYISGLRKFLDILEAHEEIPLPYYGTDPTYSRMSINFLRCGADNKAAMAAAARVLPGPLEKGTTAETYFDLRGSIDGFFYELTALRSEVCERVVTGVETITMTVPDPAVTVPTVEVTQEVETVEWRCGSILA
jgi:hypothetical protein